MTLGCCKASNETRGEGHEYDLSYNGHREGKANSRKGQNYLLKKKKNKYHPKYSVFFIEPNEQKLF